MPDVDVIVIGAGHNGLVAASYLARAGLRVSVLERRKTVGGACVTEELVPGARFSTCAYVVSSLRPQVTQDLQLEKFGLELYASDVLNFVMGSSGEHFFLWPEVDRSVRELERLSKHDAQAFIDFGLRFRRFAKFMEPHLLGSPPLLSALLAEFEKAGEIDLWHEFVTLSIGDLLDRYFEHELLKGLLMFFALVAIHAGPTSPGTAYEFSHHSWGEYKGEVGRFAFARGGMGSITNSLAAVARHHGAEIHTGVAVDRIIIKDGRVAGVRLQDGTLLGCKFVVSNADPFHTFVQLLNPTDLPSGLLKKARQIDMRGSMGRIHLLVDQLPQFVGMPPGEGPQHRGFTLLGATPAEFERGWEAQQRGELMDNYPIEMIIQSTTDPTLAPAGLHTITTVIQQLPFNLSEGTWDTRRQEFTERVLRSLFRFAPNLEGAIRGHFALTPLDLQREYGLTGGNIFHGAMFTNQLFASRPLPGLGGYRTPVKGLYLCGAGTHPGGAVMGACGHNSAKALLADLDIVSQRRSVGVKSVAVRSEGTKSEGILDRLATSDRLRTLRTWEVRHTWSRPLARILTRKS